ESALRRPGNDGNKDLRPPDRLAELDLSAPQRGRRPGRAETLRQRRAADIRQGQGVVSAEPATGHSGSRASGCPESMIPAGAKFAWPVVMGSGSRVEPGPDHDPGRSAGTTEIEVP